MSDNLIIEIQKAGNGRTLALINGKLYSLLVGYDDHRAGGWFFLAVAGRTPLKADDLDQHWQVEKSGQIYLAFAQRPFSYHLGQAVGDRGTEPPYACDWPRLKAPPYHYTFVGPTQEAVQAQVLLPWSSTGPTSPPRTSWTAPSACPTRPGAGRTHC